MNLTKQIAPILDKEFKDYNELVDNLEKQIVANLPLVELPLAHTVTPGLYTRRMVAPKGTIITSKPHLTKHQFEISEGAILVYDDIHKRWQELRAPFLGITEAGTRRIGYVLEDVVWTTMHATPLVEDKDYTQEEFIKLIEDIEDSIIDPRENNLLNT